jgi:uncharacterized protein (DUF697 family)
MAKKRPAFNLPSTDKGAAAPATDWVYKSDASIAPAAAVVIQTPVEIVTPAEIVAVTVSTPRTPRSIINNYSCLAAAAGLIPMPLVDLVAISALQLKMIQELADHFELEFNEQIAKSLIASIAASAGATGLGYRAARSFMKFVPVVGTLGAMVTMPAAAYSATFAVGEVFAKHFANGGTLFNMTPAPAAA